MHLSLDGLHDAIRLSPALVFAVRCRRSFGLVLPTVPSSGACLPPPPIPCVRPRPRFSLPMVFPARCRQVSSFGPCPQLSPALVLALRRRHLLSLGSLPDSPRRWCLPPAAASCFFWPRPRRSQVLSPTVPCHGACSPLPAMSFPRTLSTTVPGPGACFPLTPIFFVRPCPQLSLALVIALRYRP